MKQFDLNLNEYVFDNLDTQERLNIHGYFEEYSLNETFYYIVDAILVS